MGVKNKLVLKKTFNEKLSILSQWATAQFMDRSNYALLRSIIIHKLKILETTRQKNAQTFQK